MSINFDKQLRIAGYKPVLFKNAIRGFMRTNSPGSMIELKSIFPHRRDGAIVFEECLDRSFIEERDGLIVTAAGEALARGKASPRTPIDKALPVLDDFLTRVDAMNRDSQAVRYVDEVWLFGSVLRQAETVGDIDLALVTRRRPKYTRDSGYSRMLSHLQKLFADRDDVPLNPPLYWLPDNWHMQRALFGAKRHRLLAVKDDTTELELLGVPCRLIYNRSRGGRVDAPMLARHPNSKGRLNDIDPPAELPDLTPMRLRPMDARWLSCFEPWGSVSPPQIFRGWSAEAHNLFPRNTKNLAVATDGFQPFHNSWIPKHIKKGGLDGRRAVVLINSDGSSGFSVVLRRHIETSGSTWTLAASFEQIETHRSRRLGSLAAWDIAAAAALILAVDAERMLRRSAETASFPKIDVRIRGEQSRHAFHISWLVRGILEHRNVRIEPVGWTGDSVTILWDDDPNSPTS